VANLTRARVVVDMVNGWQSSAWTAAGFNLYRLGTGSVNG